MRNFLLGNTSLVVFGAETGTASAAPRELPDLTATGNLVDATEEMATINDEMVSFREELRDFQRNSESLTSRMSRTLTKYALRMQQGGFFIQGEGKHETPTTLNLEQLRTYADGKLELKALDQSFGGQSRQKISAGYASRIVNTACKAALLASAQFDGFCVAPFQGNTLKIAIPDANGKYPAGTIEKVACQWNMIEPFFVGAKDKPDVQNSDQSIVPASAAQIDVSYGVKFESKKRDKFGKLLKGADEVVAFEKLINDCMKVFGLDPEDGEVKSGNTSADFENHYSKYLHKISDLKTRLQDIEGAVMAGITVVDGERKYDSQASMTYMVNQLGEQVAEKSGAKKVAGGRK